MEFVDTLFSRQLGVLVFSWALEVIKVKNVVHYATKQIKFCLIKLLSTQQFLIK